MRLLKVHYIDSKGNDNRKPQGTYAFLIEPEKQLARRLEGVLIDRQNLSPLKDSGKSGMPSINFTKTSSF